MDLSDNTKTHIQLALLTQTIETNMREQKRLTKTVYGDGNGEKGLVVRTDRIEQRSKWIQGVVATPIVAYIGKLLFDTFHKH